MSYEQRRRLTIPFGEGMDRTTGETSVDPRSFSYIINGFPAEQRLMTRGGLTTASTVSAGDVIAHVQHYRAQGILLVVGYNVTTRVVKLYSTSIAGLNPTLIGTWGTLSASAVRPPRFTMAEMQGLMLMAHDEANLAHRLSTFVYNPGAPSFAALSQSLDGAAAAPVKFRGVVEHLQYIFGWGYGSASDATRPEIMRVCKPGEPEDWDAQHYWLVGVRGDPIISATPVGETLHVHKHTGTEAITGTSAIDFGSSSVDDIYGCVGARLTITIGGRAYVWSQEGPRVSEGGRYQDLALPLDLQRALPTPLPAMGTVQSGFAVYLPIDRQLLFCFPDIAEGTTLAFALSLREDRPRWSYQHLQQAVWHGAWAQAGSESVLTAPGTASNLVGTGTSGSGAASIAMDWDHNNQIGDEQIELWIRGPFTGAPAGTWSLSKVVSINQSANQATTLTTGVTGSGDYQIAIRYKRSGLFATGYDTSDPAAWPSAARVTGTVVALGTPNMAAPTWTAGDPDKVYLTWSPLADATHDVEIERSQNGGAWANIVTLSAPTTAAYTHTVGTNGSGTGNSSRYRAREKKGVVVGSYGAIGTVTVGYAAPILVRGAFNAIELAPVDYPSPGATTTLRFAWSAANVPAGANLSADWYSRTPAVADNYEGDANVFVATQTYASPIGTTAERTVTSHRWYAVKNVYFYTVAGAVTVKSLTTGSVADYESGAGWAGLQSVFFQPWNHTITPYGTAGYSLTWGPSVPGYRAIVAEGNAARTAYTTVWSNANGSITTINVDPRKYSTTVPPSGGYFRHQWESYSGVSAAHRTHNYYGAPRWV